MTALKYVRISTKLHIHNRRLVLSQDHACRIIGQFFHIDETIDGSIFPFLEVVEWTRSITRIIYLAINFNQCMTI